MKTIGIVAEYNPFHNGHAFHIAESRKRAGEDAVVIAAMSGDFVQRGEAAVYSKLARAEAACRCGADLVVELPVPWCIASAEGFARAAVHLLAALGADTLSFGCETEDLQELETVAALLQREEFIEEVRSYLTRYPDCSFAAARQAVAGQILGRSLPCMSLPNSILALEYLKAIQRGNYHIRPDAVLRKGSSHDAAGSDVLTSAADLRSRLRSGLSIASAVPDAAEKVYARERMAGRELSDEKLGGLLMLSRLRFLKRADFDAVPDAGNGLGGRLYDAVQKETDYSKVLQTASTRRYPLARIRRVALYAALGVTESDFSALPEYARVLAFNDRGRAFLHRRDDSDHALPVLIRPSSVRSVSAAAENRFQLGSAAHDFFTLHYRDTAVQRCGEDWRSGPVVCS